MGCKFPLCCVVQPSKLSRYIFYKLFSYFEAYAMDYIHKYYYTLINTGEKE